MLSCGGTQIDPVSGKDVVWNDNTPFDVSVKGGGGWASGGGISKVFPVPDYQSHANVPVCLVSGQPGRGVPDIAMNARNYLVRVDSSEVRSGGTSAVAPLMAALVAQTQPGEGKERRLPEPLPVRECGERRGRRCHGWDEYHHEYLAGVQRRSGLERLYRVRYTRWDCDPQ